MLLRQGAIAFEHRFGQETDISGMRQGLGL